MNPRATSRDGLTMRHLTTGAVLCLLAVTPRMAHAHRVNAEATVSDDGSAIRVEAWLAGGKTPQTGRVTVLRPDGSEYLRGSLADGVFEFRPDRAERYTIHVDLGEGHARTIELTDAQAAAIRPTGASVPPAGTPTSRPPDGPDAARAHHGVPAPDPGPRPSYKAPRPANAREENAALPVVAGLAAIAALVALATALSTNRRLRRIEASLRIGETTPHEHTPR